MARPQRWINVTEFQEFEDYDLRLTVGNDLGLYVTTALYNNWDSITGWKHTPAPAAQQYGFRLREWVATEKDKQVVRERMAALADEKEPF